MPPLVSIVVTSYNHLEFLPQRMESLLAQTYPNTEIIIVDDASTDGSREYLEQFRTRPNIQLYLLEKNHGYAYASNFGVSKASGEWVIFAECDDFSHPDQIAHLYQATKTSTNIGVVVSESNLVDKKGKLLGTDFQYSNKSFQQICQQNRLIPGEMARKLLLLTNFIPNMSAALFRKSLFFSIEGLSEKFRLSADFNLWMMMAGMSDIYYMRLPLNYFRFHTDTLRSREGAAIQLIEKIEIIAPMKVNLKLSRLEQIRYKLNLGNMWVNSAMNDFGSFTRTFLSVLYRTFDKEPFLLLFFILVCPLKFGRKIARMVKR